MADGASTVLPTQKFPGAFAPQFWGGAIFAPPFFNFGPGGNALKSAQVVTLLLMGHFILSILGGIWEKYYIFSLSYPLK